MLLNSGFFVLSLISSSCLFAISVVLYSNHVHRPAKPYKLVLTHPGQLVDLSSYLGPQTSIIPPHSLTAILPVISVDIHHILRLLEPFLDRQDRIREVFVVCPDTITSSVRRVLQRIFASKNSETHPEISLLSFRGNLDPTSASLRAAADSTTDWVLVMDHEGLTGLPRPVVAALLHPPNVQLPFGPSGKSIDLVQAPQSSSWGDVIAAKYLRPPFVVPRSCCRILLDDPEASWACPGLSLEDGHLHSFGGLLIGGNVSNISVLQVSGADPMDLSACRDPVPNQISRKQGKSNLNDVLSLGPIPISNAKNSTTLPSFIILLPHRRDLQQLLPLICRMRKSEDKRLRILIYDDDVYTYSQNKWETEQTSINNCTIQYEVLTGRPLVLFHDAQLILHDWVGTSEGQEDIDVIICLEAEDSTVNYLTSKRRHPPFSTATVVRFPRSDLGQTEWMSSLTLDEWTSWHLPSVDISVITNDRPMSLKRLLRSLMDARYFGDKLDLRIYVEQNCDEETLRIVENVTWPFGNIFIHRRVVHAGLLPAIVESWYPRNNDSYGLLLEDDIELSPLFYAWIKMSLLRYRYGASHNRIPALFGISLYQQKNIELSMEGRRTFNPRVLFFNGGFEFANTPYLSQVPCSWGAVYFPEHWREFHDFLAMRLSEIQMMLEDDIVPHVRSNHWLKSWKRFFIELVFLRGYVMLYPNYADFKSLSTNHLEVGSHVKDRSREKQDLFVLPLMPLEQTGECSQLLDIPHHTLPPIDNLPVLNLTGSLASMAEIVERGYSRRLELASCDIAPELYDVRSLMCIHTL